MSVSSLALTRSLLKYDVSLQHAWHAYGTFLASSTMGSTKLTRDHSAERDAMGADEYHPISHEGTNLTAAGGIGYTVVDALDTMMIMGLDDEVARARKWIDEKLSFDKSGNFSTFEVGVSSTPLLIFAKITVHRQQSES